MDRAELIAEFGSWEEANQYKQERHYSCATIIGVEKKPLEPGAGAIREQPGNQPVVTVEGSNASNCNPAKELKKASAPGDSNRNTSGQDAAKPEDRPVGGEPSLETGETGKLAKAGIPESKPEPDSKKASPRFLLVDKSGTIAEFGSWQEANQYRKEHHHHCASIIGVGKRSVDASAVQEKPANQAANQQPNQPAANASSSASTEGSADQELQQPKNPGDDHPKSPGQQGSLPANSKVMRVGGRISPAAARTVTRNARRPLLTNRYELLVTSNAPVTNLVAGGNYTASQCETINILYTAEPTNGSHRG